MSETECDVLAGRQLGRFGGAAEHMHPLHTAAPARLVVAEARSLQQLEVGPACTHLRAPARLKDPLPLPQCFQRMPAHQLSLSDRPRRACRCPAPWSSDG